MTTPEPDKSQEGDAVAVYLAGIAALEQQATHGPWRAEATHGRDIADEYWSDSRISGAGGKPVAITYLTSVMETDRTDEDEAFIVAARSAVPRLLGALDIAMQQHRPVPSVRLVPCEPHKHWRGSLCGVPEFGQEFETENLRVRRACPDCEVFDEPYCRACVDDDRTYQDWPCKPYRDITAELLRKESP